MLTNEEKVDYINKVSKQLTNGDFLQTSVLTCSDNCKKLKMQFKMSVKCEIIKLNIIQNKN